MNINRFTGWWGYRDDKRFLMEPGFDAAQGADGWQISTPPIILLTLHKAALDIFEQAGGVQRLRDKSEILTGYLEFLIQEINKKAGGELLRIITPSDKRERGCQLSMVCTLKAKEIFRYLAENGVIGDWREPNVIRLSPVPLYNSFKDIFEAGRVLDAAVANIGL